MTLHIIGGTFRSRLLKSPKGELTRPTLAVMRKAVFDILQTRIDDAHFLDLYAGSGAKPVHCTRTSLDGGLVEESHLESSICRGFTIG